MISLQLLQNRKIIKLITRLKIETPDYPSHLMIARKTDFIKQVVAINISGIPQSNQTNLSSETGETVNILSGLSTAQGILLQVVIGVWIIAAMLTVAYVFRNQIIDFLQQNNIMLVESTPVDPAATDVSTYPAIINPTLEPTLEIPLISTATASSEPSITNNSNDSSNAENPPNTSSEDSKDDPGLHLGQTPGPPNPPGHGKQEKK